MMTETLEILKKGPEALEELETALKQMTREARIAFAKEVERLELSAPRIVFYDYAAQEWLI